VRRWFRARLPAALAALVVLAAGLGVRATATGAFGKYAGIALYAMMIYALVLCAVPWTRPAVTAAIATGISWAVEFAQLTPVPAALSAHSALARLALGATFSPPDLAWYAVGAAIACGAQVGISRRIRRYECRPQTHPRRRA
jgi:Protein of unknown function (DUF2809)